MDLDLGIDQNFRIWLISFGDLEFVRILILDNQA